jgi:hypothetical protein
MNGNAVLSSIYLHGIQELAGMGQSGLIANNPLI